jgi:hypothetical protein
LSEQDPIRIFVAHEFHDDTDYLRVFEYLESRDKFFYLNTARTDVMPAGPEAIREELRRQIDAAEIVLVPVPTYERNRDLVRFQMDVAQAAKKPVLGIQSFGGTIVVPQELLDRADDIVEWNDRTITDSIRRLARNEATAQWETIEFKLD